MHSSTYHCISLFTSLTARSQSFRQDTPSPRGLTQNVLGTYTWHQSKRRLQLSHRLPVRKLLETLVNNGGDHPGLLMQCYGKNTIETSNIHRAWILRLFIQLSRLIEPSNTESTGNVKAQFLESLLLNGSTGCIYANRPSTRASMFDRHLARFQDCNSRHSISLLSSSRLAFLAGEAAYESLGLPEEVLVEVSTTRAF